jgi:hypothetical protein
MTKFGKALSAVAMAAVLTASQALAAEGPLPAPGKPAGVTAAQHSSKLLLIGGAALVTVIAIVIATQSSSNAVCGAACVAPATST